MERLQLNVPDMYADHHVLKVRAVLGALAPQVQNVVASSAFRVVALDFDPAATSAESIQAALAEAGYPVASQPGAVNPVVSAARGQTDPAWDRLGLRMSKTDARDTKTAR